MQAYFEPEQAFPISMPQPVFEISIAYIKKTCISIVDACTQHEVCDGVEQVTCWEISRQRDNKQQKTIKKMKN